MPTKKEKLWESVHSVFHVEIKVGRSWVPSSATTVDSYEKAKVDADEALKDRSVSGARVVETFVLRKAAVVWEESSGPIFKAPKKMKDSHGKIACPKCKKLASVKTDGVNKWTFCVHCNSSLPVADA